MARRRSVVVLPEAARGFEGARRWLTQAGSGQAGARRWAALAAVRRLVADHPDLGTPMDTPGLRQLAVSGYRVVYYVPVGPAAADPVLIVTVLAPGQP